MSGYGYMGKLFTAVSAALEFNTATLSGAIDIVVIEDDEGRRHCSPFHVRFGKLQLLKSRGIPVNIELNGQRTNLRMLLGAAGEAYFYNPNYAAEHEHDESDPPVAELRPHTSVSNHLELEPPQLALPVRSNTQPLSDSPHRLFGTPTQDLTSEEHSPPSVGPGGKGSVSNLPRIAKIDRPKSGKPWDSLSTLPSQVTETTTSDYPFGYISDSEVELTRNERAGTTEVVDEPRSPPLFPSQRKWSSTVAQNLPVAHGSDHGDTLEGNVGSEKSPVEEDGEPSGDQNSSVFGLSASPSRDSSKKGEISMEKSKHESSPTSPQDESMGQVAGERKSSDTKESRLEDTEGSVTVSVSITDIVGEEDGKLDCRSVDGYDADDDNAEDLQEQVAFVLSRPRSLSLKRQRDSGSATDTGLDSTAVSEQIDSAASGLEDGGEVASSREGVVSMSLCGSLLLNDMEEAQIMELFQRHQVTYDEFSTNPSLLYDPSLLFRIDNRLVELRVAIPFILSALAFNQRMDIDLLARITAPESKTESQAPKSPPTPSRRFSWFGWASPAVVGEPLLQEEDLNVLDIVNEADGNLEENAEDAAQNPIVSESGDREIVNGEGKSKGLEESLLQSADTSVSDKGAESVGDVDKPVDYSGVETTDPLQGTEPKSKTTGPATVSLSFSELDPDALSLRPTLQELNELDLKPGANTIRFVVDSSAVELDCRIFLWSCHTKIAISDVDGTITRSDVLGHLLPAVGRDWSQVGVAGLYTQIEKNGYQMLYLTARPIGQASQTRAFLHNVTQGSAKLPNGPVLMSPNRLVESFTREVIRRKPQEFKIAALREVRCLFAPDYNPFHAGFGNRDTDVISYRAVGLIPQRIFVVNPKGELVVMKAKYESAASYSTLQDLVESVFPDISGHTGLEKIQALTESSTYNDWNYWKESLPELDLEELLNPS